MIRNSELVHQFRYALEEMAELVESIGIETQAYTDPDLHSFTQLDPSAQLKTLLDLRASVDSLSYSLKLFNPEIPLKRSRKSERAHATNAVSVN